MNISFRNISLVVFMNSRRHCRCPQTIGLNYVFSACFGLAVFLSAIVALCWSAASCSSEYDCDFVVDAAADVVVSPAAPICDCCWLGHSPVEEEYQV